VEAGIEEMRQGEALWAATGAVVTRAFYQALLAEGLVQAGRDDEALALLREAWAQIGRSGERYWAPELARAIGELQLRRAAPDDAAARVEAEGWLERALHEARDKGLDALGLRAAMALAAHRAAQGRRAEATALLRPALDALHEGHGTRDVRRAQALLGEWTAAGAAGAA
jgi:predicted ATPase